jgi:hypothetical protein
MREMAYAAASCWAVSISSSPTDSTCDAHALRTVERQVNSDTVAVPRVRPQLLTGAGVHVLSEALGAPCLFVTHPTLVIGQAEDAAGNWSLAQ